MRHFSTYMTIGALLCMAATAHAEAPDPAGMIGAGLFATAALGVGVAATVAVANTSDDEPDSPGGLYVLAGWGYAAAGTTTAVMAYVLADHLGQKRRARAAVTVVPRAGPTGAGASVLGRF
jgi:hypothetical protein